MTIASFSDYRSGLASLEQARRSGTRVVLGRSTDPFPVTILTRGGHVNVLTLIDQHVQLDPGFLKDDLIIVLNDSLASINITPSGVTINGSSGAFSLGAGSIGTLVAISTDAFRSLPGAGGGSGSANWGGIGGSLSDQADLAAQLGLFATRDNPIFIGQSTFSGGMRFPNSLATVSGQLTASVHGGGQYATGGAITLPTDTGFRVTLIIKNTAHTIGLPGATPAPSFAVGDIVQIWVESTGAVHWIKNAGTLFATTTVLTYDQRVAALPGLVSYWKLQGNANDAQGLQNGAFTAPGPELSVPTIVLDDAGGTCIAFHGTSNIWMQVPHNAAHKTAIGYMAVTFQCDTPGTGGAGIAEKAMLITGDLSDLAGGFGLEVDVSGRPRFYVREPTTNTARFLELNAGDVVADQAYTLIAEWGAPFMKLSLYGPNGNFIRTASNGSATYQAAVLSGTSPFRMGVWWTGTTSRHDGPFGRVIWGNQRLNEAQRSSIARAQTIIHT